MESFATAYPVLFNDGEKEVEKGVLGIHSCLTFKRFQAMVGQKTGLPCAQISCVFVYKRGDKKHTIPINEKTHFGIICSQHIPTRERDCFFSASLKRSKKERKAQKKRADCDATDDDFHASKDETGASRVEDSEMTEALPELTVREQERRLLPERPGRHEEPCAPSVADTSRTNALGSVRPESAAVTEGRVLSTAPSQPQTKQGPVAVEQSAWKKGSLLERLASGEDKPVLEQLQPQRVLIAESAALGDGKNKAPGFRKSTADEASKSGTVSPTSVLEPSQTRVPSPVTTPQVLAVGAKPSVPSDRGGFELFGTNLTSVDLRALVQDAMASNSHFRASTWCKFCAFHRDRNVATPPFHWCVDDQVISGFRGPNPAGPIGERPLKHRVAAA